MLTDDLSYNKQAIQSHTYAGMYVASFTVDRNTLTCMRAREIGRNSPQKTIWWKVDLGRVYKIDNIAILFRNYDGVGMYLLHKIPAATAAFKILVKGAWPVYIFF